MLAARAFGALLLLSSLAACNMVFAIPDRELDESCGKAGNACCPGFRCTAGAVCDGTACIAAAGACNHDGDCARGQKCTGPTGCGPTLCAKCGTQVGTQPLYATCTVGTDCQSGFCDGARHCTVACSSGTTGDAECAAAFDAAGVCTEFGVFNDKTPVNRVGFCARRCGNDADCAASGEVCVVTSNWGYNRLDLICRPPKTTGKLGDVCKTGDECRSNLCNASKGACSVICKTDADCAAPLPRCASAILPLPRDGAKATVSLCSQ